MYDHNRYISSTTPQLLQKASVTIDNTYSAVLYAPAKSANDPRMTTSLELNTSTLQQTFLHETFDIKA